MPKIKLDKLKVSNSGVSQIVGTILLLAIAVVLFSAFMVYILSNPVTPSPPNANLAGSMEVTRAVIEHKGGESWKIDNSKIIVRLGDVEERIINFANGNSSNSNASFVDINTNSWWDIGESLEIDCSGLFGRNTSNWQIEMMIIDLPSNSIIMDSIVNAGLMDYLFTNNSQLQGAANFDWTPKPACVKNIISFEDESINSTYIINWTWNFGDGNKAYVKNPTHKYENSNNYNVTLNVTYDPGVVASGVKNWDTASKDVYVSDIPTIVDNSPSNAYTGDSYTFSASVTDSDGISAVYVEYWFGSGSHINVSMSNTDGNTWTKEIAIPPNSLAPLHYIFSASDTLGFWNSTPAQTTPVLDNDPPALTDNTPSTATTGDSFTFNATVTDNIGTSNVYVEYWYGIGIHNNISMSNVADNYWELTMIIDDTLDTLHYIISANDSSDNWNNTGTNDIAVSDNDPPSITDYSPEYAFVDDDFVFNASVVDNIGVANVYVIYWIDGGASTNASMSSAGGSYYEHTYPISTSGATLYYSFAANDTSNNWAESTVFNRTLFSGHVHNVDQGTWYDEIYDATDDANPGDTIKVYPGTYDTHGSGNQDIVIDDDGVQLIGGSSPDTIILVSQQDGITVTASNVLIKNITMIKNSQGKSFKKGIYLNGASNVTIENCDISEAQSAIYIISSSAVNIINCTLHSNLQHGIYVGDESSNVYIDGNKIYDNDESGILVEKSDLTTITNNTIYNNSDGDGVYLYRALSNIVKQNDIYGNDNGVTLKGASQEGTKLNFITQNTIHNNHIGIEFVEHARQNNITYNSIHNNSQYGIEVTFSTNAENNLNNFNHNNLIDNNVNAYDECNNQWDDGYSEGNWWDDYVGPGPYTISGGNNQDNYPLMNPV